MIGIYSPLRRAVGIRAKTTTANVHDMRRTGKETDHLARAKDGVTIVNHAGDRSLPQVIGDIDVPLTHSIATDPADEVGNRIGHGIHMPRCPGNRLCKHTSVLS